MLTRRSLFGVLGLFALGDTETQSQEIQKEQKEFEGPICLSTLVACDGRYKKIKVKQPLILEVAGEDVVIPICPIEGNPKDWHSHLISMVNNFQESCDLDLKFGKA